MGEKNFFSTNDSVLTTNIYRIIKFHKDDNHDSWSSWYHASTKCEFKN